MHSCGFQGRNLVFGAALPAGDDSSRMAHAASGRCRDASNKRDHRLVGLIISLQPLGGILFCTATDLTDHDDTLCRRVIHEALQAIDEVRAVKWVSADTHAS